jgi:hypothetical protein
MGLVEDAQALRAKIDAAQTAARVTIDDQLADLPDDTYDSVLPLFPDWVSGETGGGGCGAVVRRQPVPLCAGAHDTGRLDPTVGPCLVGCGERQTQGPTVDPWVQPTGSQDAYQVGDRVTFEGQTWESTAANNVWSPGVYGWTVV